MLLDESKMTIKQVATECGFENEFHFSSTFKRAVGVAPQAYRRQAKSFDLSPGLRGIARLIGGGLTEQYLPAGQLPSRDS
jgi:AraC-like DNA-binding protein